MRRSTLLLVGAASLAMCPAIVAAQSLPTRPEPDPTVSALEDVVVTARRVEERLQDIPLAVTALSGESMAERQITEVRDLSALVPNLAIREAEGERQAVTISIRGQGAQSVLLSIDSAVGFYVDGVNVPRTLGFRNALADIQRAEILRGPQGTLYGRNTTGGAVSIYTQDPKETFGGFLQTSLGNYSDVGITGALNLPISEGIGLRLVAQRSEHEGYGRDGNGDETQDEDAWYLRAKLKAQAGAWTAVLAADYSQNEGGGSTSNLSGLSPAAGTAPIGGSLTQEIARALGQPLTPAGYAVAVNYLTAILNDGNHYRSASTYPQVSEFQGHGASLNVGWDINDSLTFRSITGYRFIDRLNRQELSGVLNAFSNLQTADDSFYSEELQLVGNGDRLDWVIGAFYSKEDGRETSNSYSLPRTTAGRTSVFDADVYGESAAVFGQATFAVTPQLSLTLGGRYTRETKGLVTRNSVVSGAGVTTCSVPTTLRDAATVCQATLEDTFSDPSWLASIDYKISEGVLVYGKVARGFRAGGQNFRGTTIASLTPFQPETVTEYEVGLKSEFLDRRVRLNLAAFHSDYEDVQRIATFFADNIIGTAYVNAASATLRGIEAEGTWRVTPGLTMNATAGWLDAQYTEFRDFTGDRSNETWPAPKFTGSWSGRYVLSTSVGDLAVQANYAYQSDRELYPSPAAPAFTTQHAYGLLSARISLDLDRWGAEIAAYGRNLTDEEYASAAFTVAGFGVKIAGEPRTFGLEFRKRFGGG